MYESYWHSNRKQFFVYDTQFNHLAAPDNALKHDGYRALFNGRFVNCIKHSKPFSIPKMIAYSSLFSDIFTSKLQGFRKLDEELISKYGKVFGQVNMYFTITVSGTGTKFVAHVFKVSNGYLLPDFEDQSHK